MRTPQYNVTRASTQDPLPAFEIKMLTCASSAIDDVYSMEEEDVSDVSKGTRKPKR